MGYICNEKAQRWFSLWVDVSRSAAQINGTSYGNIRQFRVVVHIGDYSLDESELLRMQEVCQHQGNADMQLPTLRPLWPVPK